jgi:glycosyltransferase involved in cell wall biosynthesis
MTSPAPPLISVLLPFYNAQTTLDETLHSIRRQTFSHFELVAVDDGSSDASAAIVAAHAGEDPRIRLLQPGRQGVVGAMNSALAAARAAVVARMDADDLMAPERLALQYQRLCAEPQLAAVGSQVRLFPEDEIQAGLQEYIRWQNSCLTPQDIADEIYVELPIAHPSLMFRRDIVLALGGYRDGLFPEDYDLLLRLHQAGHAMAKVAQVLLHWRESPGRLTRTDPRCSREAFTRLRTEFLARDPRLHSGRPLVICGAGRRTRQRAQLLLDHGFHPAAWLDIDPRKIGNMVHGVPVHPPQWLAREEKPFVLSYVTNHGARDIIAAQLQAMGYRRGRDYLMVG